MCPERNLSYPWSVMILWMRNILHGFAPYQTIEILITTVYNWLQPNSTSFHLRPDSFGYVFTNWVHKQLTVSICSFFYSSFIFLWKSIKGSNIITFYNIKVTCNHTIHHLLSYKIDPHKIDLFTYLICFLHQLLSDK